MGQGRGGGSLAISNNDWNKEMKEKEITFKYFGAVLVPGVSHFFLKTYHPGLTDITSLKTDRISVSVSVLVPKE